MKTYEYDFGFAQVTVVDLESPNQKEIWKKAGIEFIRGIERWKRETGSKYPTDEQLYLTDEEIEQLRYVDKSELDDDVIEFLKERFPDYD